MSRSRPAATCHASTPRSAGVEGPKNLVRTIKRNFGISIDNYVEIDFQSFRDLVEVLGGVPVYFATPVRDKKTGLDVDAAGCRMLDPVQALAYARSRHFDYKDDDGKWRTDGTGDLGRITRQQDFIKRALRRAADKGLRNPSTAVGVVNAAAGSVTLDQSLDVGTIVSLLSKFQSFNPDSLASVQVPTVSAQRRSRLPGDRLGRGGAAAGAVPGLDPEAPLQPRNVIVDVAGRESRAEELVRIATQLDAVEFDAEVVEDSSKVQRTTITYGPSGRDAAVLLAAQLDVMPEFDLDEDLPGNRVVLEVGPDFGTVRTEAVPVDQLPGDLLPPVTTADTTPETSIETTSSTETTVDPEAPQGDGVDPSSPSRPRRCPAWCRPTPRRQPSAADSIQCGTRSGHPSSRIVQEREMSNRIAVIGTGYVGLTTGSVSGAPRPRRGLRRQRRRQGRPTPRGEMPILEDGLDELVAEGRAAGRLRFASDAVDGVVDREFVLLCVPTPQGADGSADLSYIEAAASRSAHTWPPERSSSTSRPCRSGRPAWSSSPRSRRRARGVEPGVPA